MEALRCADGRRDQPGQGMTTPVARDVGPVTDVASLHTLLQLALGISPAADVFDWPSLLQAAERERLLGISWKQSAEWIRAAAPPAVIGRWKRNALLLGVHAEHQLRMLATALDALSRAGVDAVVLKGAPLAQRLYGDFTVRPSVDVDLYVLAAEREVARPVLGALGWQCTGGAAPEEETFELRDGSELFRLEVHSTPLDDPLLHRVVLPIERAITQVGDYALPSHTGRFLPAYLAAHLAKHFAKPLLWVLDFYVLWTTLGAEEQADAITAAHSSGLARHLDWAISISADVAESVRERTPGRASGRLARALRTRGDAGRLLHLASLAPTRLGALSVLSGRLWPAEWRAGWRQAPEYFVRRAIRWIYRHVIFEQPSASSAQDNPIVLSTVDSARQLADALQKSEAWIKPGDGSMEPAIPTFALARVVGIDRPLQVGDVVVTANANGRCGVSRVLSLGAGTLRVRPDARFKGEQQLPHSAILGRCDVVDVAGRRTPIEARPYGSLGLLRAILRSRLDALIPSIGKVRVQ